MSNPNPIPHIARTGLAGSKFTEHMPPTTIPGYCKSARIMYSLENQQSLIQIAGPGAQDPAVWILDDPAYLDPLDEPPIPKPAPAVPVKGGDGAAKRPVIKLGDARVSPMRQTLSKFRDNLGGAKHLFARTEKVTIPTPTKQAEFFPTASSARRGSISSITSLKSLKDGIRSSLDFFRKEDDFGVGKYDKGAWKRK